jgi:hypothetical protein
VISTVAGNGTAGYSGDGGPATAARLDYPGGVAVDGAGDLFIADSGNYRVRKVDAGGVITTVAGDGTPGYSGDGGPATAAQLSAVAGLAFDGSGNLFIADYSNDRVREVSVATALQVSAPAEVTAGDAFAVTVTAAEADGTADPEYQGTVTLTSADPRWAGDLTHTFTPADAGTFTFTGVRLFTAGPQSLSAADGTLAGGSADVAVLPGAAAYLLLSAPAGAQAGVPFDLVVTVQDAYGNTVTGYTGTLTFRTDDPDGSVPADYTFTAADAGSHTFAGGVTLFADGSTVTARGTQLDSVTGSIVVLLV